MKQQELSALVTDMSSDIVYISDTEDYSLIYLNKTAIDAFALQDKKWVGEKCYAILQGKDAPCPFCTNHILSVDEFIQWEYHNPIMDQRFFLRDKLIEVNGKLARLEIATNITRQTKLEEELEERLLEQKTLNSCIDTLFKLSSPSISINMLLETIAVYYKAERGYIFSNDKEGNTISNTYEWCNEGVESQIEILQNVDKTDLEHWYERYRTHGMFYIDSVNEQVLPGTKEYEILTEQGIESLITAPIYNGEDEIIGFIGVDNPQIHSRNPYIINAVSGFIAESFAKLELMDSLHFLSFSDSLTGLKNRHSYSKRMEDFQNNHLGSLGVAYIDINGLKLVNDVNGHVYGDKIIISLGNILKNQFGEDAYRVGGDEFLVLCENITKEQFQLEMEQLKDSIAKEENLRASVGYTWNEECDSITRQIEVADSYMYIEKQKYYESSLASPKYNALLSENLINEINQGRFTVYLQPQINLKTGMIEGAEALIRRIDDEGSIVAPGEFLPFYEREGIIYHLDLFVFERVCKELKRFDKLNPDNNLRISVNFSRISILEKGLPKHLREIRDRYGIGEGRIMIEITETVRGIDSKLLAEIISTFTTEGFYVSYDDFGSGYSNFEIITFTEFDEIKIDRSLINNIDSNDKSRIVTQLAIDVCCNLSKKTSSIAEGVESDIQYQILKKMNCNLGQGYFFDRPMGISVFEEKYIVNNPVFDCQ